MKKKYSTQHSITTFSVGDLVLFPIPKKLQKATKISRIPGCIYKIRNRGYYEICTQYGIVKEPFLGNELIKPGETYDAQIPISVSKIVPLLKVVKAHLTTARPTSCTCKQGCSNYQCSCRKGNTECSTYCHRGKHYTN